MKLKHLIRIFATEFSTVFYESLALIEIKYRISMRVVKTFHSRVIVARDIVFDMKIICSEMSRAPGNSN